MLGIDTGSVATSLRRVVATAQNGLEVIRLGGLETDAVPSEFTVVARDRMYRLRRYFPESDQTGPPVVLVPPMMMSADVYDVTRDQGGVGIMHEAGLDPWVVDFGSPATEEGGWNRTLADHIVAISEIIDIVADRTGRDVHLGGYSQGGMFCYQAAAYRSSRNIASIITFGSPVDTLAALPLGIPANVATKGAEFLAEHVFTRLDVTDWMARTGFQLLDPAKTVKSRIDFLLQLHDRDALLPRESQRRFLAMDGWVAWSGPAVAELLTQFVVHNRMMTGGFSIRGKVVSLAELTMPILAFVGEVDDIGQPLAVRGIRKAAPRAEVYEAGLRAGHFGLVVGSTAATQTWPTTSAWIRWREGLGPRPIEAQEMAYDEHPASESGVSVANRLVHTAATIAEVGLGLGRGFASAAAGAVRGSREISSEAARTLPRLARLGQLQPHSQVSLGRLLAEQARRASQGECFVFDDRVYSYSAVDQRIDNVVRGLIINGVRPAMHVGVLMETRPSALAAVAALSRIGAVAVMLQPSGDLSAAIKLGRVSLLIVDPDNLAGSAAYGLDVLVLGGGESRSLDIDDEDAVVDLEQIDPSTVELPGWYVPNPGRARELAFVLFSGTEDALDAKFITNYRWALSAFGTAGSAGLSRSDTVYCLAPLHHSAGLLVAVGGALVGGSRIALSRGLEPERFADEIQRYGVTVVSYTWTMMRELLDYPGLPHRGQHAIRLLIGSGMPTNLWRRSLERLAPARVLEFYASTEGDVVLANVAGTKIGAKGRPLPGSARVALAAYDPVSGRYLVDDRGFVRQSEPGEPGLLLGRPGLDDASGAFMRGVFSAGDVWTPTDLLFRRDEGGDYWLLGHKRSIVATARGPIYPQPIVDAMGEASAVDLAVAYGIGDHGSQWSICAVTVRSGENLTAATVSEALLALDPAERPDLVHVVKDIALSRAFRPLDVALRSAGLPAPGVKTWYLASSSGEYKRLTKAVAAERFSVPQ
ncbi:AMP-binding protein [Rhodococcus sp. MEB064]|uniref:AMP-binding protein n=1 Tax=Rhodococcus sp. MEB064 TaxID=1587522 RepID=UPI0005ABCAE4|nr:AMP-binding protein [Rhodococcus sp. MEB064]KIQ19697.1 acyl-CoA synthetase [Rhodococcus sp. MEB064]